MKLQKISLYISHNFSITSCSQPTISNKYYGTNNTIKNLTLMLKLIDQIKILPLMR